MKKIVLVLVLIAAGTAVCAQAAGGDEAAIRAAMAAQAANWNRADIPAFMQTYENSPTGRYCSPRKEQALVTSSNTPRSS